MFSKIAKFRMLPAWRPAPDAIAPANDNRPGVRQAKTRRARAARLICRWSLTDGADRPTCRWELEQPDEPNPSMPGAPPSARLFHKHVGHKSVFRQAYQGRPVGDAARDAGFVPDPKVRSHDAKLHSANSVMLHARH